MLTSRLDEELPFARFARACFWIGAIAVLSVCARSGATLLDKPMTEDGYYLLAVARNLALGRGLTIDGERLTNGIQPLFTFLAAPAYVLAGGDRIEGLRGVLLLHGACFVTAAWSFGVVLRDWLGGGERLRWIGALSWLASGYLFLLSHNGLETGTLLLLYLAYWRLWQRRPLQGLAAAALHGALLGVLVLARIDATFFVAAVCGRHVLRGDREFGVRLREAAVAGAVAVVVSSPWWVFNVVEFRALMPTSGAAQSSSTDDAGGIVGSRVGAAAKNLLLVATPVLYVGDGAGSARLLAVRAVLLAAVGIVLWRVRPVPRGGRAASSDGRPVAFALLAAGAVLVVWYAWRFWATHFYNRYYVLLAPFGMAAWAVAAERVVARLPALGRLLPAGLGAAAVMLAVVSHTGILFAGNQWLRDQVPLVRAHAAAGGVIAAGQSGTLGYFVDGVHNLDGKVNVEALRHQGSMGEYLAKYHVEWLCDWPVYVHRYVDAARLAAEWELVDRRGEFELWHHRGR